MSTAAARPTLWLEPHHSLALLASERSRSDRLRGEPGALPGEKSAGQRPAPGRVRRSAGSPGSTGRTRRLNQVDHRHEANHVCAGQTGFDSVELRGFEPLTFSHGSADPTLRRTSACLGRTRSILRPMPRIEPFPDLTLPDGSARLGEPRAVFLLTFRCPAKRADGSQPSTPGSERPSPRRAPTRAC
jgi:hypothetical protein